MSARLGSACRCSLIFPLLGALLSLWTGGAAAQAESARSILVLPAENSSGQHAAVTQLPALIVEELRREGLVVRSNEEIRELLRRLRIRSVGQIRKADAERLAAETGARALLFLGLEVYREDELGVELGLSGRLLELEDYGISAAVSVGATGQSYAKSFGRGRIDSMSGLVDRIVPDFVHRLIEAETANVGRTKASRIAIVPFENMSANRSASVLLANAFISGFVFAGYDVLEPGFSHELFLQHQTMHRGAIDLDALLLLHEQLGVDYILTGSVEELQPARGDLEFAIPSVNFAVRLLKASNGNIVFTDEFEGDGSSSEGFFGRGRTTLLTRFLESAVTRKVDKMRNAIGGESHARKNP